MIITILQKTYSVISLIIYTVIKTNKNRESFHALDNFHLQDPS
jgi:hypothetical protein